VSTSQDPEVGRLHALESYHILDTPPDPAFDDLTALASYICATPISLVTLVGGDRQWFKSKVGLDMDETPREVSFCTHALDQSDVFVVNDARLDERFADNPFVTSDPSIRFYAGAPLVTARGHALGTLCVIDRQPRELSDQQREALRALSRATMAQLELHRHNEHLRELDRLKDDFVAVVSHELRTPVSAIHGYVELLLDDEAGALGDAQQQFVRIIGRNSDRLLGLVEEMLLLAEAEAGGLSLERRRVDLGAIVSEAVESFRPAATAEQVSLRSAGARGVLVDGDPRRLAQIVDNLVSNALKYTPGGGDVAAHTERRDGEVILEVTDTGIGIPSDDLPRLFSRFFRTSAAQDAAIPGTGLGLAITQALVSSHGGVIEVDSEPGAGSTFRVRLPAAD
jgi:signal transduction histidine kinase